MSSSSDPLNRQFAKISREFVRTRWDTLWMADGGASCSLLPIIALLTWGRRNDEPTAVSGDRLRALSGLSPELLDRASGTLWRQLKLPVDTTTRTGPVRVWPCPALLSADDYFAFRGRIAASGLWAQLKPSERTVTAAIASSVPAENRNYGWDDNCWWDLPENVLQWLIGLGIEVLGEREEDVSEDGSFHPSHIFVRRFGRQSLRELSVSTGMDPSTVLRAIRRLSEFPSGAPLLRSYAGQDGYWFHLPANWWGSDREMGLRLGPHEVLDEWAYAVRRSMRNPSVPNREEVLEMKGIKRKDGEQQIPASSTPASAAVSDSSGGKDQEDWLAPYIEAVRRRYGGIPNPGKLAKILLSLHKQHGQERVIENFERYLDETEAEFYSPTRFAETFGAWNDPRRSKACMARETLGPGRMIEPAEPRDLSYGRRL